jgi:hypothetical protein
LDQHHITLVACAASKRDVPSAARDLHLSQLFIASKRFAVATSDSWYILSALHEVLEPDRVIDKYEKTLNGMPISQRREWAARVNARLLAILPDGSRVTILAGKNYREFVEPFLREHGFDVHVPLASLRIGEQVQWLQRANLARSSSEPQRGNDVIG